ncbi:MAG: hypothetical protein WA117_17320, partial [Verrucomicrobiia bacterium]
MKTCPWKILVSFLVTLLLAMIVPARDAHGEETGKSQNPIAGFEGLFDTFERFNQETSQCVVVIDLTDPADLP